MKLEGSIPIDHDAEFERPGLTVARLRAEIERRCAEEKVKIVGQIIVSLDTAKIDEAQNMRYVAEVEPIDATP